jgi:hypothetical protein
MGWELPGTASAPCEQVNGLRFARCSAALQLLGSMRNSILAAFSGVLLTLPFVAMPISPLGANVRNDLGGGVERIVTHAVSAMVPANGAGGVAIAVHIAGRSRRIPYSMSPLSEKCSRQRS